MVGVFFLCDWKEKDRFADTGTFRLSGKMKSFGMETEETVEWISSSKDEKVVLNWQVEVKIISIHKSAKQGIESEKK